ncbi:MAG: DUF6514 family protein [Oscillospiraceae bacterium]|jgi:hypothetical protein|nr:DUF6514 family protein [Oscillospiraceae bacterium]
METHLFTRGYVHVDDEPGYTLEYYLESGSGNVYGIRVAAYQQGVLLDESREMLSTDYNYVQNTIKYLSENFVFPSHLADILEDVELVTLKTGGNNGYRHIRAFGVPHLGQRLQHSV